MISSEQDNIKYDICFKVIVIGEAAVGKSCLTGRAVKNIFITDYSPTIAINVENFITTIENKIIKLEIFDTCGQECYRSLISSFYRNTSLAMVVYAINSRESFNHINDWHNEIKIYSNPDVKIILIGNKSDLKDEREISYEEAQQLKDEKDFYILKKLQLKLG